MFSLFYGLWKYLFSKTEFHVLILGIDKAGKTTLLEKLKSLYSNLEGLPPDRIVPTVGLNIGRLEVSNTKLVFWDLGGQVGLRTIWEKYYEEAHAVIYVIDAACPSRFEDSKSALEKILRHEDLRGAPVLILANKQDLPGAVSAEEVARYLDFKELDDRHYMYEAVSAYEGLIDVDDNDSDVAADGLVGLGSLLPKEDQPSKLAEVKNDLFQDTQPSAAQPGFTVPVW